MPDTKTHSRVGVFLSYVHEDNDILQAVLPAFEVIRQQTQQQLEIFYDKKSIDGDDIFDNIIRDALRKSDYLIILYSEAYKESHSYTGFELGYFASLMDDEQQTSGNTSRQIVSMYVGDPPAPLRGIQGINLGISAGELSSNRDIYMERVRTNVDNDALTDFFNSVADKVEDRLKDTPYRITSKERLERFQAVQKIVTALRGEMYDCLSSRVKRSSIHRPQSKLNEPLKSGPPAIRLFYSYSHKDETLREKLETHLTQLRREGYIHEWHDRKIGAGQEWKDSINENLEAAKVILLLVSSDFIASEYCYDTEMDRALEKHRAGEARVIPIILRHCDWDSAPFAELQALPKDAKPVTKWSNRDEAWTDVARGIRRVVKELRKGLFKED